MWYVTLHLDLRDGSTLRWEIAPKSQFVCVKGTLIRFGFRAGAKAIQYNEHSLSLAFNSNSGMLENGLVLPWYEYQMKEKSINCFVWGRFVINAFLVTMFGIQTRM